uniref:39S ribosomal protein L59, mitochondrial n=1 Tax=Panagrolaimus sp. JU765 TaxID=591449 RepID=A0AC34QMT2_9BILA
MGLVKNIIHTATKDWKNANYQLKAVLKAKAISEGEKVLAPKYPTESEHFNKVQTDPNIKKAIDEKDEKLIENVNKINIKSTDPPERWTSTKQLPTRETEWEHKNDPTWEFGYYEPPLEKMEKDRIMLREALDLLRNRMEFELPGPNGGKRGFADEALKKYSEHPAVKRIDQEKLERMWQYFRPFERSETQRVVRKEDLEELGKVLEGQSDNLIPEHQEVKLAIDEKKDESHRSFMARRLLQLQTNEQRQLLEAIQEKKEAETKRLNERLKDLKLLQEELDAKEGKK